MPLLQEQLKLFFFSEGPLLFSYVGTNPCCDQPAGQGWQASPLCKPCPQLFLVFKEISLKKSYNLQTDLMTRLPAALGRWTLDSKGLSSSKPAIYLSLRSDCPSCLKLFGIFFYPSQGGALGEPEEGCDGLVAWLCVRGLTSNCRCNPLGLPHGVAVDVAPLMCKNRSTCPGLFGSTIPVSVGA